MKYLAIDIGASGGKAFIGELKNGSLQVKELRRFPNRMIETESGKRWDVRCLYDEVLKCISDAPDADSVGIDTWAVDYGYVDRHGTLLDSPFAYRDSRTEKSIPWVHERISRKELYSITGIQFLPFNTIYQISHDLISRPWIVEKANKLLMIPELLSFFLTGHEVSEYTNASTTGFLDARTHLWSKDILDKIQFPVEKLPDIVRPGSLAVELTEKVRDETNSHASLAYAACHDTACAVAAVPVTQSDDSEWAFISSGTWSLIGTELDQPIVTDSARDANFTNEGGVGNKIRFLTNVTGLWIFDELRKSWARRGIEPDIETIIREAEIDPQVIYIHDPDDERFSAPDDMLTAFEMYCAEMGREMPDQIGTLTRWIFESLALACAAKIDKLRELTGKSIGRIYMVGGGSNNRLLCQLTANACRALVIAGPTDATAIGNILMQAIARKEIADISEGRHMVAQAFRPAEYYPSS